MEYIKLADYIYTFDKSYEMGHVMLETDKYIILSSYVTDLYVVIDPYDGNILKFEKKENLEKILKKKYLYDIGGFDLIEDDDLINIDKDLIIVMIDYYLDYILETIG